MAKPFLKWAGGKRRLLPELLAAIDKCGGFDRYYEPFLGSGALFFELQQKGLIQRQAKLGDISVPLMYTYLGVRDYLESVINELRKHARLHGEAYYKKVRGSKPKKLSSKAARMIYLNRTCYNGLYRENDKGEFNVPMGQYDDPDIVREDVLRSASDALQDTQLTCLDFSESCRSAETGDLIYLDPPYIPLSPTSSFTKFSAKGFGELDHHRLAIIFHELKERGVLAITSNSWTPSTQKLYKDFYITRVYARRSINSQGEKRNSIAEALITTFPIE